MPMNQPVPPPGHRSIIERPERAAGPQVIGKALGRRGFYSKSLRTDMKAKDVQTMLARAMGPAFSAAGFSRSKPALSFVKEGSGRKILVTFGFTHLVTALEDLGSNFILIVTLFPGSGSTRYETFATSRFLSSDERLELERINYSVYQRARESWLEYGTTPPSPASPPEQAARDKTLRFHYRDADDVARIVAFLGPRMSRMLGDFTEFAKEIWQP